MSTLAPPPPAFLAALAAEAAHPWADAPVIYFDETTSTNDVALRLASEGAVEGTSVVALAQTAGRGRRGRTWTSPPGAGVYFTVILRPSPTASGEGGASSRLTLIAAVAAADAIERVSGVSPQIKWPNDLVIDRGRDAHGAWQRRKLAGILTEGAVAGGAIQHVVVGIGINLEPTNYPPDVAATSLAAEAGGNPGPARVFAACRARLAIEHANWRASGWADIAHRWRERSPSSEGYRVRWADASHEIEGVSAGLDPDGALRITDATGRLHRIVSGEVLWE